MPKKPTVAQMRRWKKVAALGCLVCRQPAELHHCRHECGMGQKNHSHVAPLCPVHHRHHKQSRHGNLRWFAENIGTDRELHERTKKLLGE